MDQSPRSPMPAAATCEAIRPPIDLPPIASRSRRALVRWRTAAITARQQASNLSFGSGIRRLCSLYRKLKVTTSMPRAANPVAKFTIKALV